MIMKRVILLMHLLTSVGLTSGSVNLPYNEGHEDNMSPVNGTNTNTGVSTVTNSYLVDPKDNITRESLDDVDFYPSNQNSQIISHNNDTSDGEYSYQSYKMDVFNLPEKKIRGKTNCMHQLRFSNRTTFSYNCSSGRVSQLASSRTLMPMMHLVDIDVTLTSERTERRNLLEIANILNQVISGPLKDRRVTLVLPKTSERSMIVEDELLHMLDRPVFIIRAPKFMPVGYNNSLDTSALTSPFPMSAKGNTIVVMPFEDDLWWPLWTPPKHWETGAMVMVSTYYDCWKRSYLISRLSLITPLVTILCPYLPRGASPSSKMFKLYSWKPFASQKKLIDQGIWNSSVFQTWDDLFVDRFQDMTEKEMSILCNGVDRPFFYEWPNGERTGQLLRILEVLAQWLNFTYAIDSEPSMSFVIIRDVVEKGERDLMLNYATLTLDRYQRFQFTVPYAYEGFTMTLKIPPPLPQWQNILYPFEWEVWTAMGVSLICVAFTYHFLYRQVEDSFWNNAITVSQSLLSNPVATIPTGWRVRYFLVTWWIVSWMLGMSYTANLIAILTIPVFPSRIETLSELEKSDLRLCMLDFGEFVIDALRTSDVPVLHALGAKMDVAPLRDDLPEIGVELCLDYVIAGTHAHTEGGPLAITLYVMEGLDSQVYTMKPKLYENYLGIIVNKQQPWKFKFDIGIQRLRQAGLVDKWYSEVMEEFAGTSYKEKKNKKKRTLELKPFSIAHLQGDFLILLLGYISGVFVWSIEVLDPFKKLKR